MSGDLFDLIAGAWMAFHANAQGRAVFRSSATPCCASRRSARAIFAPLITIIALSASKASSASMRRSVAPGRCFGKYLSQLLWKRFIRSSKPDCGVGVTEIPASEEAGYSSRHGPCNCCSPGLQTRGFLRWSLALRLTRFAQTLFELRESLCQLIKFRSPLGERGFQPLHDMFGSAASKGPASSRRF